jgi:hypothetical protein
MIWIVITECRSRCSHNPRSLIENNIGDAGAQHLAKALAGNTTLQTLM